MLGLNLQLHASRASKCSTNWTTTPSQNKPLTWGPQVNCEEEGFPFQRPHTQLHFEKAQARVALLHLGFYSNFWSQTIWPKRQKQENMAKVFCPHGWSPGERHEVPEKGMMSAGLHRPGGLSRQHCRPSQPNGVIWTWYKIPKSDGWWNHIDRKHFWKNVLWHYLVISTQRNEKSNLHWKKDHISRLVLASNRLVSWSLL